MNSIPTSQEKNHQVPRPKNESNQPIANRRESNGKEPLNPFKIHQLAAGSSTADTQTPIDTIPKVQPDQPSSASIGKENTLTSKIQKIRVEAGTPWSFRIDSGGNGIEQAIANNSGTKFTIRKLIDSYYGYDSTRESDQHVPTDPIEYDSFKSAIAALIEAMDWGTLPPGKPTYWHYNGYAEEQESFEEYLSGSTNQECGDHYFGNQSADYGIHMETYQDRRRRARESSTISILTISTKAEKEEGDSIYRERFQGQRDAFNATLSLLDNSLSETIYKHESSPVGEPILPSIEKLTTFEAGSSSRSV